MTNSECGLCIFNLTPRRKVAKYFFVNSLCGLAALRADVKR